MKISTRKEFLQTSAVLMAAAFAGASFDSKKNKPLLSFSTLGCPDWDFGEITDFAVENSYAGIEIRGILREMDLTKCDIFSTAKKISATMQMMKEKGLKFVDLGSSANMHIADPVERKKNLDDARRFIDLAQEINCPFVRVFPNSLPKEKGKNETMDLIAKGLLELGDYAKDSTVSVLMETHGEVTNSDDLEKIMRSAQHDHTGLVWDVANM